MTEPSTNPTRSQVDEPLLGRLTRETEELKQVWLRTWRPEDRKAFLNKDIERHRVMKGHPPTGPIFRKPSTKEIEQRIRRFRKRTDDLLESNPV